MDCMVLHGFAWYCLADTFIAKRTEYYHLQIVSDKLTKMHTQDIYVLLLLITVVDKSDDKES